MAERSTEQRRASARCLQLPCGYCYRQQLEDLIRQLRSQVDEIKRTADGETSEYQQERLAELQAVLVDCMILRDEMGQKASWFEPIRKRGKMLRDKVAELRSRIDKAMKDLQAFDPVSLLITMAERSIEQRRASARCLQLPCGYCYRQQLEDVIRQLQSKVDEIKGTADGETSEYQQERLAELQTILVDCMILRDETDQKASFLKTIRKRGKMLRDRVAGLRSRTGKAMEYLQASSREQLEDVIRQLQSEVNTIKRTADGEASEYQQKRLAGLQTILVDCMILRDEMGQKASWYESIRKRGKMLRDRVAELRSRTDKAMKDLQVSLLTICKGSTEQLEDETGQKPIREKVKALRDRSAELISGSDKAMEDVQGNHMDRQDDQTLPSPELILSKSANKAAVQIMQALKDEEVNLIGLVGYPGVGKTTLVRQIERKAKGSGLFHHVVMLHAQRQKSLEMNRDFVRQRIKKQNLQEKLQQRKNILVILEDVWWENPDLKGIGLLGDDHNARTGLKILVTTCFPKVCTSLRCDTTIKLEGLTEEEVEALVERFISGRSDYPYKHWRDLIIGASEGLPYTIVTTINVVLSKSSNYSRIANPPISKYLKPYYDYLNEQEGKICLIISRFPEDYAPTEEVVIRYLIGQQVLEGAETGSIEGIRSEVRVLISNLQANSFLTMENGTLKITNLFRMFLLKSSQSNKPSPMKKSRKVDALTTSIDTDGKPESEVTGELKVLNLRGSQNDCSSPPPSIQLSVSVLENLPKTLETLLLSCFTLSKDDMTWLGKLTKLKILSFNRCDIVELPNDLGELRDLRLLDLSDCLRLPTFGPNMLQGLSKLEELYINSTADSEVKTEASDSILRQISSLSKLTVVSIQIQCKGLPTKMVLRKLPRYEIEINTKGENRDLPSTALRNVFQDLLPDTEHLFLAGEKGSTIPNLVPRLDRNGLNALKDLKLHHCETMQCIIDLPGYQGTRPALENLTSLELVGLPSLKGLCNGEGLISFGNLKVIKISKCKELSDPLFSPLVAQGLTQLETLELNSCINLSDIAKDCDRGCFPTLSTIKIGSCTKLKRVFEIRIFEGHAKFKDIEITDCKALEHVFVDGSTNNDDTFELPHLQRLVLTGLKKLDSICQGKDILMVPSLQEFRLEHLPTLKPFLLAHSKLARNATTEEQRNCNEEQRTCNISFLPQLKVLELKGLESTPKKGISLREKSTSFSCLIVAAFQELFDDQSQYFLSNLKELKFSNASHLTTLRKNCSGGTSQNLIRLELIECTKLRHVFTLVLVKNVPKLQYLTIEKCSRLEQIVTDDQTSSGASTATREAEPRTYFPNLVEISIENCDELRSVFRTRFLQFPKLKRFHVKGASKLIHIFAANYAQDQGKMSQHKYLEIPKLQELSLVDLKSLITFAPMDYGIGFPSLSFLTIKGCPKMETTFVTKSGACVYAGTEVRSSVDESSTLMKILSEERKKLLSIILEASPSSVIGERSKTNLLKECFQENGKRDVKWESKARKVEPILYDSKDIMEELFCGQESVLAPTTS